jgi:hypothetical protein
VSPHPAPGSPKRGGASPPRNSLRVLIPPAAAASSAGMSEPELSVVSRFILAISTLMMKKTESDIGVLVWIIKLNLFEFFNNHKTLNTKAYWGTLEDYQTVLIEP